MSRRSNMLAVVVVRAALGLLLLESSAAAQGGAPCPEAAWVPTFGAGGGPSDDVYALAVFDDGGGPALYAGGDFTAAGGAAASHVARWDGASWSALGSGTDGKVLALAVFDDGSGPALYAGGDFSTAGGVAAGSVAKWDGASWSSLAGGGGGDVRALAVFDDGGGPALYAGGSFLSIGGVAANNAAKWDGAGWSALGSGMLNPLFAARVEALAVFDAGGGPALYAGGYFLDAGGVHAKSVARWDGASWSPVGGGIDGTVLALAMHDDGGGRALYAGGSTVSVSGGGSEGFLAKLAGGAWSAPAGALTGGSLIGGAFISSLASFDDGGGPALFAGGAFHDAGGVPASSVAKLAGGTWSPLAAGLEGGTIFVWPTIHALAAFDGGGGPELFAGGTFQESPAGDAYLAAWGCAIGAVPGCAGNPAALEALAPGAPLGAPLPLLLTGASALNGAGVVYFGAPGQDALGCGLFLPGAGELLLALAPPPHFLASGPLAGGTCALAPLVPAQAGLAHLTVQLQGAALDPSSAQPIELTGALAVTLGP